MKRFLSYLILTVCALTSVQTASAYGIDPKEDSIAIARMRQRMDKIRQKRPTVALVLSAELLFARLEYHILNNAPEVNLYMEYASRDCLDQMLMLFHNLGVRVIDLQITSSVKNDQHNACVLFSLRLNKNVNPPSLINKMLALESVISIEEL